MQLVVVSWRDLANPLAGGAEVLIDRLLRGFSDRGHDVALVCGGPVSTRPYPVIEAGSTYSQYVRAPIACATRFRSADIIIDVENGLPFFSPLWRRGPSVCLVHHVHTDQWRTQFPLPVATAGRLIESYLMPAAYRNRTFVAVSPSTANALRGIGVPHDHIAVIENGVDVPAGPLRPKSGEPLFLSLSRLVPHKRLDLILSAWERAVQQMPGQLVIAGDGPALTALRARASTIPRVSVVGRVSEEEKEHLLGEAWALISAAHHEGWGMSVMEAAAHGTPSLAVDAPGVRDSIIDGVTGVLVRTSEGRLPVELARAWVDLVSDRGRINQMGAAAREWASRFSWAATTDNWLELLQRAVDSGRVTRRRGSGPSLVR